MPDAVRLGGICQFGCRETVHPVIGLLGNPRFGVRNTRQVDHRLDIPEQRPPFDRTSQIGDGDDLDRPWENICRLPHRCSHRVSGVGKLVDQGPSDKTRCAGHKYARHDIPRAKQRMPGATIVASPANDGKRLFLKNTLSSCAPYIFFL